MNNPYSNEQPRPGNPPEQTTGPGYLSQQPGYPPQPLQQPMVYPPQPPMAQPQQHMQGQYPQQMQYSQPGYAPYPQQQMMMPPQPINVIVNNANNNVNMAGVGYARVRQQRPGCAMLTLSVIYFVFIGWWVGFYWALIGLVLSALGKPAGQRMMSQLPMVFFLRQSSSRQTMIY